MATIEERLKSMGLLKRYEEIKAQKNKRPLGLNTPTLKSSGIPETPTQPVQAKKPTSRVGSFQISRTGVNFPSFSQGTAITKAPTQPTPPIQPAPPIEPKLPGTAKAGQTYQIVQGDTLSEIANKFGTSVQSIMAINPNIKDPNLIIAGKNLIIPGDKEPTPTEPTPTGAPTPPVSPTGAAPELPTAPTLETKLQGFTDAITSFQTATRNQIATIRDSYTSIANAFTAQPNLVEQYQKMMDEAGIPELKTEIADLSNRARDLETKLETLPEDVRDRAKNYLTNQSQVDRLTAKEAEPLTKLYNAIARASEAKGTELELASNDVMNAMNLMQKDMDRQTEVLEWIAEGAQSVAELETRLAEKGIDFAREALDLFRDLEGGEALKSSDISTFTDANGVVTAVNKATGQTLWQLQIGRAGGTAPNISVSPIADPTTGTARYTQITDRDNGEVRYVDNTTGQEVPASEVQIEEGKDPIDVLIDSYLKDFFGEDINF